MDLEEFGPRDLRERLEEVSQWEADYRERLYTRWLPQVRAAIKRASEDRPSLRLFRDNNALLWQAIECAEEGWLTSDETRKFRKIQAQLQEEQEQRLYEMFSEPQVFEDPEPSARDEQDVLFPTHRELLARRKRKYPHRASSRQCYRRWLMTCLLPQRHNPETMKGESICG